MFVNAIRAIHAVAAGKHYLDPAVTEKVTTGYAHRQTNLHPERQGNLSEREEDILRRIAWGYSNKEIAAYLEISVKTVEAHKANTMKKLGLQSRIDIVRYGIRGRLDHVRGSESRNYDELSQAARMRSRFSTGWSSFGPGPSTSGPTGAMSRRST